MRAVTEAGGLAVALACLGLVVATPRPAHADSHSVANDAFDRGRKLMKAKQYAEACAAFEQSQQLDPQFGTQFNLADCETALGKLTAAWAGFRELARADTNKDRRALAAKLAGDLEQRLPHLTLQAPAPPDGLVILLDGKDSTALVGEAIPLDLGAHAVVARAPGFVELTRPITVDQEASSQTVVVHLEPTPPPVDPAPAVAVAPVGPDPADGLTRSGHSRRRTVGAVAVVGGGAVLVGGLVAGGLAYRAWHDATGCDTCTGDDRRSRSQHAQLLGNVSTVLVVTGLVAASAGVYLWKTSSSSALVAPQGGPDSVGVAILGSFW